MQCERVGESTTPGNKQNKRQNIIIDDIILQ